MSTLNEFETNSLSHNPEVFVDFLSIKSLKQRYLQRSSDGLGGGDGGGAVTDFSMWNRRLDEDFETFVKEFPIDDNISECFASSSDDTIRNSDSTVSGDDAHRGQRVKVKSEKDNTKSKVTEAVCFLEKKITQNRKQKPKIGNNLFRRKDNRGEELTAKKSLSYDDLRRTEDNYLFPQSDTCSLEGGCTGQSIRSRNKALFGSQRRCRVLTDSNANRSRQGQTRPCATNTANTITVTADITPNTATNNRNYNFTSNSCNHSSSCNNINNDGAVRCGADSECSGNRNGRFHGNGFQRPKVDVGHNNSVSLGPGIKEKGRQSSTVDCGVWSQKKNGLVTHKILKRALMESPQLKVDPNGLSWLGDTCRECEELRMSKTSYTLAHCAAHNGHLHCLQVLVEKASDVTALNPQGMRPSQVALLAGHTDCWNYLAVFELSHILLREICNFGSLIERVNNQLESVKSEAEMLRHSLESRSHDLRNQVQSVQEVTRSIQRTLEPHPPHAHHYYRHHQHHQSSKHQCPAQEAATYQTIKESLTLLERVECDLAELCQVNGDGGSSRNGNPKGSVEWILKKIEKLTMDDSHINDIRQLENVEKRCRVIRNFLLLDDNRQTAAKWHEGHINRGGTSTDSMHSGISSCSSSSNSSNGGSSSRQRRVPRRGHPSASCASSPSSRARAAQCGESALNAAEGKLRHTLPRRRYQQQQQQQQQHQQEQEQPLQQRWLHQQWQQQQPPSRQHAGRPYSPSKKSGNRSDEASRMFGSSLVLASSVTDTTDMDSSSDWESSSQDSIESGMNPRSEGPSLYVKQKPSTSNCWSYVTTKSGERNNLLDVDARVHGKCLPCSLSSEPLTDAESEPASMNTNGQGSQGSLRQERLATHFQYLEKNREIHDGNLLGQIEVVEKYEPGSKNSRGGNLLSNHQLNNVAIGNNNNNKTKNKNDNGNRCQNRYEAECEAAPHTSATLPDPAGRNFQTGPTSPTSAHSPDHEYRSWAHNANRPLKRKESLKNNANIQRRDFIGRCRQTIDDDGVDFSQSTSLGGCQTSERPWYDISDDDTSVYTSTYGMVGYDSESSFYT